MNMQQIMQQAQRMQRDITKKKEEIDKMEFLGKSEWVEIVFNGKREIKSFKILKDEIADLILVGNPAEVKEKAGQFDISKATIVDPATFD